MLKTARGRGHSVDHSIRLCLILVFIHLTRSSSDTTSVLTAWIFQQFPLSLTAREQCFAFQNGFHLMGAFTVIEMGHEMPCISLTNVKIVKKVIHVQ